MTEARFVCPHCYAQFTLSDPPPGQAVACPSCGNPIEIPSSDAVTSPDTEQPRDDEPFIPFDFRSEAGAPRGGHQSIRPPVKVRQLTRSERSRRQRRRSLFLMVVGTLVLLGAVVLLSKF